MLSPGLFQGLTELQRKRSLTYFHETSLAPGVQVIREGDLDPTLCVVRSGALRVSTGGVVLSEAGPGDLIGEVSLFAGGLRTASVHTVTPCELLLLTREGYEGLRLTGDPVARAVELHALRQLTERCRSVGARIGAVAAGAPVAQVLPDPVAIEELATSLGAGRVLAGPQLDGASVLAGSPLFDQVEVELLRAVAEHFEPFAVEGGHLLCVEGEPADALYVLSSGTVEVWVSTEPERVQHVATLTGGDAFGSVALVDPTRPRMASCVARGPVTGLKLDEAAWRSGGVAGLDLPESVLRVAIIRSLADQLTFATAELVQHELQRQRPEHDHVLRASAAYEAHGAVQPTKSAAP